MRVLRAVSGEESIAIHGGHNHRIAKRTMQPCKATIRQHISPTGHHPPAKTQHHRHWTRLPAKTREMARLFLMRHECIRMRDSTEEHEPNYRLGGKGGIDLLQNLKSRAKKGERSSIREFRPWKRHQTSL